MKIKKFVLWVLIKIFGFTPLNNRDAEKYRTFMEKCEFMGERGWEFRVGERGGWDGIKLSLMNIIKTNHQHSGSTESMSNVEKMLTA